MKITIPKRLGIELFFRAEERGDKDSPYVDQLISGQFDNDGMKELRWNLQQIIEIADEHYGEEPFATEAKLAKNVLTQLPNRVKGA